MIGRAIASGSATISRCILAQRGLCRPTVFAVILFSIFSLSIVAKDFDVYVYGATSDGVVAALQADRIGRSFY